MVPVWRISRRVLRIAFAVVAAIETGCGGSGFPTTAPITVSLSSSSIVVSPDGKPVFVNISIMSTSETAVVSFDGLPAGVQATYAASDTNPSGLLTFVASGNATAGTYMPIITVNSAFQTATVKFTLIVPAP